jgi:hypothetical protein
MQPTWESLDRPVLAAAVQYVEDHDWRKWPQAYDLAPVVGATPEDVGKALLRLNGEYIEASVPLGGLTQVCVDKILGSARRAIGQWPTPESLAERIVEELTTAADAEPDAKNRDKLKQTAVFLGSSGKDLFINILASVIAKGAGLG